MFRVFQTSAQSILSPTSGFIAQAGFTHSLNPARNCGFGCSYCYVPTMRIQAGLKPEDWKHWGQYTTFKSNAPELVKKQLRPHQRIYCSPLVDPYQPAEADFSLMPRLLSALIANPPRVFTIQTRGPLILRDLNLLKTLRAHVSFSIPTDRDEIRRLYEPHAPSISDRFDAVRQLHAAGIRTFVTLAPILPCHPERLIQLALDATGQHLIADPLHNRAAKPRGATTRLAAESISARHGFSEWHQPAFQAAILARMRQIAGPRLATGIEGFTRLSQDSVDG